MHKKFIPFLAFLATSIGVLGQSQTDVEENFLSMPSSDRFRNHLQELTKAPHPAGSEESRAVIQYMKDVMEKAGLEVEVHDYDIYFPKEPGINEVMLVSPVEMPLATKEVPLDEDPFSTDPRISHGWNSFSGSGDVTGEIVYANYGRREDFEKLKELGISVESKIVMARYGGNFRGFKAKYAEANGAAGLIMYTDPEDAGYMRGFTYPEGKFYSEHTIQRGSVLTLNYTGDPLTPFQPALPLDGSTSVPRLDPKEVAFHTIPVTPIGYGAAREIMSRMTGKEAVPPDWQGGLPFTYRLEGGPELKVRLHVEQEIKFNRVSNVVGTLEGSEYPDEWIIMGAHHDPWTFGASDPNSGTAMLLSLSESLGMLAAQGNRPKRTIKIAHWDAEEHGILGSVEWVEQFREELTEKAVAYFNADGAVSGPNFGAASSPSLKGLLVESTKRVQHPKEGKSVFEVWSQGGEEGQPRIGNLGGGSDHVGFYAHLGIPSLGAGSGGPTLYHSGYDDFHWYSTFADPDFVFGPMVEQVFGIMALRLANGDLLPYSLSQYARDINTHRETIEGVANGNGGEEVQLTLLKDAAGQLEEVASRFDAVRANQSLNKKQTAEINQRLIALEKNWIHDEGMPFGKWYRSLFGAPDPFSGYASWMLPGLRYFADQSDMESLKAWERIYVEQTEALKGDIEELLQLLE